jgi:uncharacterized protein (TIGR03086 family)
MDLLELHRRAVDGVVRLVASIGEDRLDLPTPCPDWIVRDLLQHLVDATLGFVGGTEGLDATVHRPVGDDPSGAFAAACEMAVTAFGSPGLLEREVRFPGFGRVPGRVLVGGHLVDVLVHRWDLARAIGAPAELDEDLATAALRIAGRYPDDPVVRGPGAAFGHPVPVPEDASPTDRLVAFLGRVPDARPAGLERTTRGAGG